MKKIIPTVFATSNHEFKERFNKLIKISKNIQIDFMDGKFVKSKSISITALPNLKKYKNNFEAHLMVKAPEKYIKKLSSKGFKKIIFHYEAIKNPNKIIQLAIKIKKLNLVPFLAINPSTPLSKILPILSYFHGALFLGVNPGKEHQHFIPKVYEKIKQLRKINKKIIIQVDGGVNENVVKKLKKLGANYINSGSFISDSKNPKQTIKNLNVLFNKK